MVSVDSLAGKFNSFTCPAMLLAASRTLVQTLPAPLGLRIVRALAGRSQRPAITAEQQQAMDKARALVYGPHDTHAAWAWGHGPLVILVHGWNGRAAQMAPLAHSISQRGYRCVAIEVTGHGNSPGQRTSWRHFIDDISALHQSMGTRVHAWVGHSAGAMTLMAARAQGRIQGGRFASICAPSHPFPPLAVIRQRLNPPERVLQRYREHIAQQFGFGWDDLKAGVVWRDAGPRQLLFYDETDRFVPHTEGDTIAALCPGARLIKTNGYSHTKILLAPEMQHAVGEFVAGDPAH